MPTPVEQIKEKIDIVEFIRSYVPLQPAGKNFKALCPFHKEKTPSFIVSPERQTWHCFGACSEGGDIFKFLMKYENLEFYEALKALAEKAGVELKRLSPADQKQFGILYDINKSAKDFFVRQLAENKEALEYLKNRGLKKETIEEFEIGFASNQYEALSLHLINSGYSAADIERSGLAFKNDRGNYTDRFRGRIMFPLNNGFGKTVGFSGRILPQYETPETGKYINSPETPIFNKSRLIFGFDKAKNHIRKQNGALLVEGQMDFLMCWQDNVKNVIAVSGTALTPEHLKTVRRLTDRLVLSFDNDEAGSKAAEKSIDLAGALDFNVKILILDKYKDPADAVAKQPGLMSKLIQQAKPAMEFYFDRYLTNDQRPITNDLSVFKKNLRIVLGKIKNLTSSIERAHWLKELSARTGIEERALAEEMEQLKTQIYADRAQIRADNISGNLREPTLSRRELIARRLLTLATADETLRPEMEKHLDYLPNDYLAVYKALTEGTRLTDPGLLKLMNLISLGSGLVESSDKKEIEKEFNTLIKHLKEEFLKERKRLIAKQIKEAEAAGDEQKLKELLKEFDKMLKMKDN